MREEKVHLALDGIRLTDARAATEVRLADLPGVWVLTLLRHRY